MENSWLLHDGRVLIVGGAFQPREGEGFGPYQYLKSAELASTGAPLVVTGAAASVGTSTATLSGSVLSSEAFATAYFQYGTGTAYGAATAAQGVAESLSGPLPVSAGLAGLSPATTYHVRLVAENPGGLTYGADQTFTTAGLPQPSPVLPAITKATQSASRWREGNRLARISRRKPPIGTTFSVSLNTQSTISFRFVKAITGRKVGHRCVATNRHNARRRACKRTVTAGTLTFGGRAGVNKVVFQGRLSSAKRLRPGRYTVLIAASNAAGRSRPVSLSFTIVR